MKKTKDNLYNFTRTYLSLVVTEIVYEIGIFTFHYEEESIILIIQAQSYLLNVIIFST